MLRWMAAALAGAALAMAAVPAEAAWQSYVNRELGFSFIAPGEVRAELGTYRGAVAGPRQTIIYRSTEDNIEYKVTVMSFIQAQAEGATLLGEREFMFQEGKKLLMDTLARVEPGRDAVYGRKMTVEHPDGRRTMGAFYFTKGRLYALEATVLPGGDPLSPDPGRFIDSVVFVLSRTAPDAIELPTPEFE